LAANVVDHEKRGQDTREMRGKKTERREESNCPRSRFNDKRPRSLNSHEGFAFEKEDVVPMTNQLLKASMIGLPPSKRPEDATRI
ncbi:hypothetical protein PJP10_32360, partial [Mycobacterium kansasii]